MQLSQAMYVVDVTDVVAEMRDFTTANVRWTISGDRSLIDHFVVYKDVLGVRTIIGRCHSEFSDDTCSFTHVLTHHDIGSHRYVIVPVHNNYELGTEVMSNNILVGRM